MTRAMLIERLQALAREHIAERSAWEALRTAIATLREPSNSIVRVCEQGLDCDQPATLRCHRCHAWFCPFHGQLVSPHPWGVCCRCQETP